MGSDDARSLMIASISAEGGDIETEFDGSKYGPAPLTESERARLTSPPGEPPPLWVAGEFPAFLETEHTRSLGPDLLDEMRALRERAPIDLRANTLKASRDDIQRELRDEGFAAEPTPYAPHGIRISEHAGASALSRTRAFADGRFEFQDEAAQIASLLCAARPGEHVLDLAAGAGGKALALAAEMKNEGEILAFDDLAERLKPLPERAGRALASCIRIARKRGGPLWGNGKFDAVLVDAPCSGTGTWRRQPELRWRVTPESLSAVGKTQAWLLDDAARHAKEGGRIIYATCSLLACENEDRVADFLTRHPEFQIAPAAAIWRGVSGAAPPPGMNQFFKATPHCTDADGFFAAVLTRRG
jgi:16S rRNA (cytosine967-C5)-methyltransferase